MDPKRILTVVTPAPNQDLITLADARAELGASRADDFRLRRYITGCSAAIATYTRRVWRQETVTETFYLGYSNNCWDWPWRHWRHPDGSPVALVLSRFPVASIASVSSPEETFDPSCYLVDAAKGLLYRTDAPDANGVAGWFWSSSPLTVTYTGGYRQVSDVPPDVQQACMTLVRHRNSSQTRDPYLRSINVPGVQEESYWVGAMGENGAMPPETVGLLTGHIDMRSA